MKAAPSPPPCARPHARDRHCPSLCPSNPVFIPCARNGPAPCPPLQTSAVLTTHHGPTSTAPLVTVGYSSLRGVATAAGGDPSEALDALAAACPVPALARLAPLYETAKRRLVVAPTATEPRVVEAVARVHHHAVYLDLRCAVERGIAELALMVKGTHLQPYITVRSRGQGQCSLPALLVCLLLVHRSLHPAPDPRFPPAHSYRPRSLRTVGSCLHPEFLVVLCPPPAGGGLSHGRTAAARWARWWAVSRLTPRWYCWRWTRGARSAACCTTLSQASGTRWRWTAYRSSRPCSSLSCCDQTAGTCCTCRCERSVWLLLPPRSPPALPRR